MSIDNGIDCALCGKGATVTRDSMDEKIVIACPDCGAYSQGTFGLHAGSVSETGRLADIVAAIETAEAEAEAEAVASAPLTFDGTDITPTNIRPVMKAAGVRQADIESATGISQGTVSRRIASGNLSDAHGTVIRSAVATLAVDRVGVAESVAAATAATGAAAAATCAAVPVGAAAGSVVIPKADLAHFDKEIYKLAEMVRTAIRQDTARMTFGLRKLLNAKRAYALYRRYGFDDALATACAFYVAIYSREHQETAAKLIELYRTVFTHAITVDPAALDYSDLPAPPDEYKHEHPVFRLVRPLLDSGDNVWLFGVTGTGKTFGVGKHFRERKGLHAVRMQCDMNTVHAHFVGMPGLRTAPGGGTETYFQHAALPRAMSAAIRGEATPRGLPFVVDELTLADSGSLMTIQAVLEGEPLVIVENGGETIVSDPGFQVVACDNTRGLGERVEYGGTQPVNDAFRDRFFFAEVDYSPHEPSIIRETMYTAPTI